MEDFTDPKKPSMKVTPKAKHILGYCGSRDTTETLRGFQITAGEQELGTSQNGFY